MLTLTDTATKVVKNIVSQNPDAEAAGLRINGTPDGLPDFALSIAQAPAAGDSIVEVEGARVFLDPTAAVALDDKVLDADIDDEGAVTFAIGLPTA